MTLPIDSDFRALLTGPAQEPRSRSSQPGGGAAGFADSLLQAGQAEPDNDDARQVPDAPAGQTAASALLVNLPAEGGPDQEAGEIAGRAAPAGDDAMARQPPLPDIAGRAPAVAADAPQSAHHTQDTDAASSRLRYSGNDTPVDPEQTRTDGDADAPDAGAAVQQAATANVTPASSDATDRVGPRPEQIADAGAAQVATGSDATRTGAGVATPSPAQQVGSTEPARRAGAGTRADAGKNNSGTTDQPAGTGTSSVDASSAPVQAGHDSLQALAGQAATTVPPAKPGTQSQQDGREANVSSAQGVAAPGKAPNTQQAPRAVARTILAEKADDIAGTDGAKAPSAAARGFETALNAVTRSDSDPSAAAALATASPAPAAPAATVVTPVAQAPLSMVPAHALVTATPADVTTLINDHMASSPDRSDRIVVQLDPPELGRISIDFRFDGQGLQHVTITGERPEALQQLRLMHHDLVQTLERNGLSGDSMSYQQQSAGHQNPQGNQPRASAAASAPSVLTDAEADAPAIVPPRKPQQTAMSGSGLDIRL
ncbi:MAG TPA: flagellar hook-length control protein FliK [Hyphomonas sp.]|nr:flagellar hook-length control protein FliK [Hyphomonas sp.]